MNKKIVGLFVIFCLLMSSVFGLSKITDKYEDIDLSAQDIEFLENIQTTLWYEDLVSALFSGNISQSTFFNMIGITGLLDKRFTDLDSISIPELEVLDDIVIENNYVNPGDASYIDEYIKIRKAEENKTYNKYLEYESMKNLQQENINKVWVHIISFTQLLIEFLNIGIYLISLYLLIYIVIEAVPDALCYMRDRLLDSALIKRGFGK